MSSTGETTPVSNLKISPDTTTSSDWKVIGKKAAIVALIIIGIAAVVFGGYYYNSQALAFDLFKYHVSSNLAADVLMVSGIIITVAFSILLKKTLSNNEAKENNAAKPPSPPTPPPPLPEPPPTPPLSVSLSTSSPPSTPSSPSSTLSPLPPSPLLEPDLTSLQQLPSPSPTGQGGYSS